MYVYISAALVTSSLAGIFLLLLDCSDPETGNPLLKVGQVDELRMGITVRNRGEDAHDTNVWLTIPEYADYRSAAGIDGSVSDGDVRARRAHRLAFIVAKLCDSLVDADACVAIKSLSSRFIKHHRCKRYVLGAHWKGVCVKVLRLVLIMKKT